MTLSIIIVSWNVKELLKKCLESIAKLQGDLDLEVIVVDNNSADGTAEQLDGGSFAPLRMTMIKNERNLGFAKANNLGIKIAKGRYILLLNPDTKVIAGTLLKVIKFMAAHSDCGVASCKHLNPDSTIQPSVRNFPTLWSQFLILYKIHHLLPNLKVFQRYFSKDFNYQKTQPVEQVPGSFMLIRREVIEKIGGLDEKFYLWFEDVDYCFRAKKAGFKVWYVAEAAIIHYGGQSFAQKLTAEKQKIFNRSMRYYFKKHHGFWPWLILLTAHFDSLFLAWLGEKLRK